MRGRARDGSQIRPAAVRPSVRLSPHLILIDTSNKIAWLKRPDLPSD
jgi:hypothetical protein